MDLAKETRSLAAGIDPARTSWTADRGDSMRLSPVRLLAAAAWVLLANAECVQAGATSDGVVRVRAVAADGTVKLGSGVVTSPGQVATACHVTRGAATVEIEYAATRTIVVSIAGSPFHDLCLLDVPTGEVAVARIRPSTDLQPGETVFAVGFQGGDRPVRREGRVAALYPFDGGSVVRTNAAFDFGASGGGLFDEAGNLVAILAFRARSGPELRFALPTEWLREEGRFADASDRDVTGTGRRAFWEMAQGDRPAFLGVAMREAAAQRP